MSTMQRLTLIGMYNYDSTLFDNVTLPEGYNKEDFINALLLEHGEKCVMYTDIPFTKYSLGIVSRKWYNELQRLYEALTAEYNPIYNFDRHEEYEDHSGTTYGKKLEADYTNSRTANLQNKTTYNSTDTTAQTVAGSNERTVSAYNSSAYEPDEKTTLNAGTMKDEKRGDDTINTTGTDKVNTKGTMESASGTDKTNSSHKGHLYGNIGVTTSEQMITQEIELRMKANLYELAGRIFANELLIQLY